MFTHCLIEVLWGRVWACVYMGCPGPLVWPTPSLHKGISRIGPCFIGGFNSSMFNPPLCHRVRRQATAEESPKYPIQEFVLGPILSVSLSLSPRWSLKASLANHTSLGSPRHDPNLDRVF